MTLLDAFNSNLEIKPVIAVSTGSKEQPEVYDDEEQRSKLDEIIDLLYAAGYFRARIKGLSSFDKVIGGMTWCIDSCDVNIDVDLLFKEDLNIGQRLSLSEKIVAVLPKINCPFRIEPHQIQGLDFIHIYPVIQWLVKHSIERRTETEEYNRSYAVNQFEKNFNLDSAIKNLGKRNIYRNVTCVQDKYRPERKFRRAGPLPATAAECISSTLFEYGLAPLTNVYSAAEDQSHTICDVVNESDSKKDKLEHNRIASTMTALSSQNVRETEARLPVGVVGSIVSLQADEIAEAVLRYTQLQAETEAGPAVKLAQMRDKCTQLEEDKKRIENDLLLKTEYLNSLLEKSKQSHEAPQLLSRTEQDSLKKLQNFVTMNEKMKEQELLFREQCKNELATLQNLVREAEEEEAESVEISEGSTAGDVGLLDRLNEKIANERLVLGLRTRTVVGFQRKLDQVPTRSELAQYQRRFMELYNLVSAKHRETKQFYASYNILNNKHQYINKELNILNSIQDNYLEAMSSMASKAQFIKQLEQIVDGVKQNKKKVEDVLNEERKNRDNLSAKLSMLIDQQRQYVAALKQLMVECHNEAASRSHSKALQL